MGCAATALAKRSIDDLSNKNFVGIAMVAARGAHLTFVFETAAGGNQSSDAGRCTRSNYLLVFLRVPTFASARAAKGQPMSEPEHSWQGRVRQRWR